MSTESSTQRFQRIVVVICLIVAPLLLAAGILVHPGEAEGGLVGTLADNPGQIEAANLLIIFSSILFVPGLLGLLRYVTGRGTVLTTIGVAMAMIGAVCHAVWAGFQIILLGIVQGGIDQAQLSALVEGDPPNAAFVIVMAMFLVGFFLGLIVLAAGLWRSQMFPRWAAVGIGLIALFNFVPVDNRAVLFIAPMVLVASFAAIALTLFRSSDAASVPEIDSVPGTGVQPQMQ
ncbi:MAG: hypothetical protein WD401_00265 [Thermomicrobiaceae bacterium]